jgi:hypothetical protein
LKLIGCIGFGAEHDIAYAHKLENMAKITAMGGFLGACALTKRMEAYPAYEDAVLYVQGKRFQDPSVINYSIVSAVQGRHGNYHLTDVARRNSYLPQLEHTETFMDALRAYMAYGALIPRRPMAPVPT